MVVPRALCPQDVARSFDGALEVTKKNQKKDKERLEAQQAADMKQEIKQIKQEQVHHFQRAQKCGPRWHVVKVLLLARSRGTVM